MDKIKRLLGRSNKDPNVTRIRRRKAAIALLTRRLSSLRFAHFPSHHPLHLSQFSRLVLFVVGYLWMIIIPSPRLGRGTYIDENALQPGQVYPIFIARSSEEVEDYPIGQYILELGGRP